MDVVVLHVRCDNVTHEHELQLCIIILIKTFPFKNVSAEIIMISRNTYLTNFWIYVNFGISFVLKFGFSSGRTQNGGTLKYQMVAKLC